MVSRRRTGRRAQQPAVVAEAAAPEAMPEAAPALKPSEDEVLEAVQSLYADQLRPSGRILRKRVAERASGLAMEDVYAAPCLLQAPLPEVDVAHLRAACEGCPLLRVEADDGGDWTAMLQGRQADFVNVHSMEDVYPAELWAAADEYFQSLQGLAMKLPGGRYACAQALLGRRLPFLAGRSLGQVCHIVQLAISSPEKKMLGYCNGTVVPYGHSQSMLKERCAEQQQPIGAEAAESATAMPLATWEVARRLLREILDEATQPGQGPAIVPLSNIKRLFRSRYRTELSETMLGHSRMADLMQDERFEDMCTLRLQKGGYVVVAKDASAASKVSPASKTISLAATLQPQAQARSSDAIISLANQLKLDRPGEDEDAKSQAMGHQPQPLRLELCLERPVRWGDIEVEDEVALEDAWQAAAAAVALPAKALSTSGIEESSGRRAETRPQQPVEFEDVTPFSSMAGQSLPTPLPSPGEPASATVRRWGASVRRAEFFPAGEVRPATGLRLPLAAREDVPPQESQEESSPRELSCTPKPGGLGAWCPEEPLWLEDAGGSTTHRSLALPTPLASPGDPGSATLRRWAGLDGGAPRRLEFFADDRPAELPAPAVPQNVLLGRTSPEKKSPGAGPDCHGSLKEAPRLLDVLPSPQRKTQALRSGMSTGGWQSLSQDFGHGGLSSSAAVSIPAISSRAPTCVFFEEEGQEQAAPVQPQHLLEDGKLDNTAGGDACLELTVRNTFLHSAPEPPLSPPGILRRSQSLPVSSLGAGACQQFLFDGTGNEECEDVVEECVEVTGPAQDAGSGPTQRLTKSVVLLAECV